jgi:hypothetical protein
MRTTSPAGFSHFRRRFAAIGTVACVSALGVAPPALGSGATAAAVKESRSKVVTVESRQIKTINVFYPGALRREGYSYACTYKVDRADQGKLKIIFHGSALGGTVCRVKALNPTAAGIKIKVTATTTRTTSRR